MSDIRFIDAQGDLLDAAMSQAAPQRTRPTPKRRRWLRPRGRSAMAGFALALVVAGCAVAATSGLFSSGERLAVGKVDCFYGTGVPGRYSAITGQDLVTGATLVVGETPAEFCEHVIEGYPPSALQGYGFKPVLNPKLVSCRRNASTAAVFIASGAADQCQQLGLKPLPGTFAAASASVRALVTGLNRVYASRNCWQPEALVRATRSTLVERGFRGWRVSIPKLSPHASPFGVGRCAVFRAGNGLQSINGAERTVQLSLGLSRSISALNNRVQKTLSADLWQHCYSQAGVRTLINQAFASTGLSPRIAITTNPNGAKGFSWGTQAEARHYAHDCPILFETWPTLNGHNMLVWLIAQDGTYLRPLTGHPPPLTDFRQS